MRFVRCLALMLLVPAWVRGQSAPPTDVYLVPLARAGAGLQVGTPVNVSARPGYDNQPSFSVDGSMLYFTSIREDEQADIYSYAIPGGGLTRTTSTPESEYSATVTPDGRHISVIRVERDSTQRLWRFPIGGASGSPSLVLSDVKPVGYHAWSNDTTLVLFVLGSPPTLQVASATSGNATTVAENIGRSLNRIPQSGRVSFVHKAGPEEWWIKSIDPQSGEIKELVRTLPRMEDHAWLDSTTILMSDGTRLFAATVAGEGPIEWRQVADLSVAGLERVTRMAVSPDGRMLAIVASDSR